MADKLDRIIVLGIDCGGTHTDGALLAVEGQRARLLASAKTLTRHDALPASIKEVLTLLAATDNGKKYLSMVDRITLGTTLEVNALVQGKADTVGLALSAGPGLNPLHFAIGDHVCIVPGGLDHRGVEVGKLYLEELAKEAAAWAAGGVAAIACVGKFSPRNPEHENKMAETARNASGLPVSVGHSLSGRLNFPRRIATAYYNAAVGRLHENFLDAMEKSFATAGLQAQCRLLKADGGAVPFTVSRKEPVQSILSGPAASVMGVLALWPEAEHGCSLLLDMGGTTTDIAIFLDGSPVIDRQGMKLEGRQTLVPSLASVSIGVGGDSLLHVENNGHAVVLPLREGSAMAFGGNRPTLLDALNTLDGASHASDRGDISASVAGLQKMAKTMGNDMETQQLAQEAVDDAMAKIAKGVYELVENINARPIYTLAALKAVREARPQRVCLVGGPAHCIRDRMAEALGLPVHIAPFPQVANAIGAALTAPTASLEVYADTGTGEISAPALNFRERIPGRYTLEDAKQKAIELLTRQLRETGSQDAKVQVVAADLFATLDDHGRGAKDMRVSCQARPGIIAVVEA